MHLEIEQSWAHMIPTRTEHALRVNNWALASFRRVYCELELNLLPAAVNSRPQGIIVLESLQQTLL